MERLRSFLRQNKIFFETVAALALSLMAVVVGVAQYKTMSQQTSLIGLQTRIAEAQALPQFEIAIKQKLNVDTAKFDDNYLVVENHGGPVHRFDSEPAYFLKVTVVTQSNSMGKVEIPVNGYFLSQAVSSSGTGVLTTIMGNHNNASFINLNHQISEAALARGWPVGFVEERILVTLSYFDLLDRPHKDYYEVPTVGGGWRLSDPDGEAAFKEWDKFPRLELSKVDPSALLNAAATTVAK
jgi:hypothetical protein